MKTLVKTTKDWFNFWWLKVPEPRSFSLLYALAYLGCLVGGVLVMFYPPSTLLGSAGKLTMVLISILYILGGLVGAMGGTREAWRFERIGVFSILLGLGGYYAIVIHTAFHSPGFRYAQMLVIYLAVLLFVVRLAMIWQYTYKPNTHRIKQVSIVK